MSLQDLHSSSIFVSIVKFVCHNSIITTKLIAPNIDLSLQNVSSINSYNQTYFDLKSDIINKNDIIIGKALADEMDIVIGDQIIITPLTNASNLAINQKF